MKIKIDIETLIAIEKAVKQKAKTGEYDFETLERIIGTGENRNETYSKVFGLAALMPLGEMTRAIREYDLSSPKMDELKFVNELAAKYNVNRNDVVLRIQCVRRINKEVLRRNSQVDYLGKRKKDEK